jgi:uncharacterized protein (TIGR03083 family)
METSPEPWIKALRTSHDRLQELVGPLGPDELRQQSYDSEWSIAQVLSHLGSQGEIFGLFLDAALNGEDAPGRETFPAIWEAWNSRSPEQQAADSLQVGEAVTQRFESLSQDQLDKLRLSLFGMDLDAAGLARVRLGEHAVHTWDVAVALDPSATVAPDAVSLLVDTLDGLAARAGRTDGHQPRRVRIATTSPDRRFTMDIGEAVTLTADDDQGSGPQLAMPAEALVRLTYGRLDPDHTPAVQGDAADLAELREIFPGF